MPESGLYNQELVSDEIREVIRYRPHWIIRNGNTIFIGIILLFAGIAWLIKYPDSFNVQGQLLQTSTGYSSELKFSKADGRKLKTEEKIIIRSAKYPQEKWMGVIANVKAQKDSFYVTLNFPNEWQTSSSKNSLAGDLLIKGEMITNDQRLLTRVINQLKQTW